VILSDISTDLLEHARRLAHELGVYDRCRFVAAPAEDLSAVATASVDVVTTRSVLIYVADKQQALAEFHRVLKPGGRLSIFEPINRFGHPQPDHSFMGYDVTPVQALAHKVRQVYQELQPLDSDPMLNFDERDLLALAEAAGFTELHLTLEASVVPLTVSTLMPPDWETLCHMAGNPKIPTLAEAMEQALTAQEREQLVAHLRPLVDRQEGVQRSALAYLRAVK
jgi:ubiquinone/menaquinone biosynthesis C-methylase UbiE